MESRHTIRFNVTVLIEPHRYITESAQFYTPLSFIQGEMSTKYRLEQTSMSVINLTL
jgi:hypothetical protein